MNFIIGVDDFGKVMQEKLAFIDKSPFIKEVLDNSHVEAMVIVRPRRFGKTLNLSMLHYFLAPEVNRLTTAGMFDQLKIAAEGSTYMCHQGKYPVIFVTFKSVIDGSYDQAKQNFGKLMSQLYKQHRMLLSSDALYPEEKLTIERILNQQASESDLIAALQDLSGYLHRHYGVKPWLLIDEYDTPIQSAYFHNHYDDMICFMRGVLGGVLKGNTDIHRVVMTGILRISKESLFSGVNNLKVFSVLHPTYAEYFGFTETEVDTALQAAHLGHLAGEIKAWYNGYHIGGRHMYNPWSIVNCMFDKGQLQSYWINTSSNELIKASMASASTHVKETFERILVGESIETRITENMVFTDLKTNSDALWSLLLFSGYLTAVKTEVVAGEFNCALQTPNREVAMLYRNVIQGWFDVSLGREGYYALLESLVMGKLEAFLCTLKQFLKESMSYFDVKGTHPEKFYHGFVLGLIVGLTDTHTVQSNKESGDGRYDVMLIPKDLRKLGLLLEFKVAREGDALLETAQEALAQIEARDYEAELRQMGIQSIVKIGLGFRGKEVEMASLCSDKGNYAL